MLQIVCRIGASADTTLYTACNAAARRLRTAGAASSIVQLASGSKTFSHAHARPFIIRSTTGSSAAMKLLNAVTRGSKFKPLAQSAVACDILSIPANTSSMILRMLSQIATPFPLYSHADCRFSASDFIAFSIFVMMERIFEKILSPNPASDHAAINA